MAHDGGLEDTSNRMANARINGRVAKNTGAPLDKGLHHINLRGQRQDRDLLGAEVHDGDSVVGTTDVPTQAVHGTDSRVAFHDWKGKAADSHGAADYSPHRLCENDFWRGGLFDRAQDGLRGETDVVEGGDCMVDRVRPTTLGKQANGGVNMMC